MRGSRDLPDFLRAGDLVVVNTSATLPAALPRAAHRRHRARAAPVDAAARRRRGPLGGRAARAGGRALPRRAARGDVLQLPGGGRATLEAPYLRRRAPLGRPARLPEPLLAYLARHGRADPLPLRPRRALPLVGLPDGLRDRARQRRDAQRRAPVHPGRAHARWRRGAYGRADRRCTPGVSSPERGERPYPERYRVPAATARLVNATRGWGGRVIAVGTTVVRALETVAARGRHGRGGRGLDRARRHPGARRARRRRPAHRLARARGLAPATCSRRSPGRALVERSYAAALQAGYLWHEFGDVHLILP